MLSFNRIELASERWPNKMMEKQSQVDSHIINKMTNIFQQLLAEEEFRNSLDSFSGPVSPYHYIPESQNHVSLFSDGVGKMDSTNKIQETQSQGEVPNELSNSEYNPLSQQKSKRIKKASKIKHHEDYVLDPDAYRKTKIEKKKKAKNGDSKISQYPTKNFLQNFKGAHMDYLKSYISLERLQSYAVTKHLLKSNNISMKVYAELYSIAEFRPVFERMFAERYLYRHMMLSRSETTAKKNHSRKISVFEEAFKLREFDHIN